MNLEMTSIEAELLIAILTFAEGAAPILQPELVAAMVELRPLRSLLMTNYLHNRMASMATESR